MPDSKNIINIFLYFDSSLLVSGLLGIVYLFCIPNIVVGGDSPPIPHRSVWFLFAVFFRVIV
jgi:hypothetical protein